MAKTLVTAEDDYPGPTTVRAEHRRAAAAAERTTGLGVFVVGPSGCPVPPDMQGLGPEWRAWIDEGT